ncbi:pyridoxamine 5'-phosphate oxidase family protein [Pseudodesulfovibrio piezophilus]|nr:pyridoxamine 5'-phosphate oxidase family protein [Pseudodesulfovibrio piezophilus]
MKIIEDLVINEEFCILATSNGIEPWTSLMTFFADHAAMKFYFLSHKNSQKSKNIKRNPHVAIHIDRREHNLSLTIAGVYSPIKKQQTAEAIKHLIPIKHPELKDFIEDDNVELIRIQGQNAQLMHGFSDKFEIKLKNS